MQTVPKYVMRGDLEAPTWLKAIWHWQCIELHNICIIGNAHKVLRLLNKFMIKYALVSILLCSCKFYDSKV